MAEEAKKRNQIALRLPFGLCKRYGISLPDKATPREAWEALKRRTGQTLKETFASLRTGKSTDGQKEQEAKQEKSAQTVEQSKEERRRANLKRYLDWQKQRRINSFERFFSGGIGEPDGKYYSFNHYIDDDNAIIVTSNVTTRLSDGKPLLVVGNNDAVFLQDWQIEPITLRSEGMHFDGFAVKLNRKYYKPYTFKRRFEGFMFDKGDEMLAFDDVIKTAKQQDELNAEVAPRGGRFIPSMQSRKLDY